MRLLALAGLLLVAACQTPCPPQDTGPVTVRYACEDDSELSVTFRRTPDTAQILQEGYAPLTLPARITGSGYRYADGGAELRGRGGEARWTRPGAAETLCREAVEG